jgi:hypothetical protein
MKPSAGLHTVVQGYRAEAAALEMMGRPWHDRRALEIAALPRIEWKGATLHTLRCHGTSGKGPHDQHVPPGLLWALVSLKDWHCPYHANDVWKARVTR